MDEVAEVTTSSASGSASLPVDSAPLSLPKAVARSPWPAKVRAGLQQLRNKSLPIVSRCTAATQALKEAAEAFEGQIEAAGGADSPGSPASPDDVQASKEDVRALKSAFSGTEFPRIVADLRFDRLLSDADKESGSKVRKGWGLPQCRCSAPSVCNGLLHVLQLLP